MTIKTKMPAASDFMRTQVQTVAPDLDLSDVVDFLLSHQVSSAPVVEIRDGKKYLVGFISERDCIDHLSNEMFYGQPKPQLTVSMMMRKHPICVSSDTPLFALVSSFISHDLRHLPVVDHGELKGIVSRCEILKQLHNYNRKVDKEDNLNRFPPDTHQLINLRFLMTGH